MEAFVLLLIPLGLPNPGRIPDARPHVDRLEPCRLRAAHSHSVREEFGLADHPPHPPTGCRLRFQLGSPFSSNGRDTQQDGQGWMLPHPRPSLWFPIPAALGRCHTLVSPGADSCLALCMLTAPLPLPWKIPVVWRGAGGPSLLQAGPSNYINSWGVLASMDPSSSTMAGTDLPPAPGMALPTWSLLRAGRGAAKSFWHQQPFWWEHHSSPGPFGMLPHIEEFWRSLSKFLSLHRPYVAVQGHSIVLGLSAENHLMALDGGAGGQKVVSPALPIAQGSGGPLGLTPGAGGCDHAELFSFWRSACSPDGAEAERDGEQEGAWGRGEIRQRHTGMGAPRLRWSVVWWENTQIQRLQVGQLLGRGSA